MANRNHPDYRPGMGVPNQELARIDETARGALDHTVSSDLDGVTLAISPSGVQHAPWRAVELWGMIQAADSDPANNRYAWKEAIRLYRSDPWNVTMGTHAGTATNLPFVCVDPETTLPVGLVVRGYLSESGDYYHALPTGDLTGMVKITSASKDAYGYYPAQLSAWLASPYPGAWIDGLTVKFLPSNGETLEVDKRYLGHYESNTPANEEVWASDRASGLTVRESDGSPSYSGVTTLEFWVDSGFQVSQPAAGVALVSLTVSGWWNTFEPRCLGNTYTSPVPLAATHFLIANETLSGCSYMTGSGVGLTFCHYVALTERRLLYLYRTPLADPFEINDAAAWFPGLVTAAGNYRTVSPVPGEFAAVMGGATSWIPSTGQRTFFFRDGTSNLWIGLVWTNGILTGFVATGAPPPPTPIPGFSGVFG